MILFSSLVMIISGIAAFPSEESPQSNVYVNNTDGKRWVGLTTSLTSFTENFPDSKLMFLGTIFKLDPTYHYSQFKITRDLNYTSWEDFLSDYTDVVFKGQTHILFHRQDKQGKIVDKLVVPNPIKLSSKLTSYRNVEETYDMRIMAVARDKQYPTQPYRDLPFNDYRQRIFSESIWVGASRVKATIDLSLEGYKKDNELILQLIYRVSSSLFLTTSGMIFEVNNLSDIVLRNW